MRNIERKALMRRLDRIAVDALDVGTAVVRGTVVKLNGGVTGKHFVHLRADTRFGADGNNDLPVPTPDQMRVGDGVT